MFAGLFRTVLYIVGVWFIWRWLDRMFGGGRRRPTASNPRAASRKAPDDSREGEYVDFEEVKD